MTHNRSVELAFQKKYLDLLKRELNFTILCFFAGPPTRNAQNKIVKLKILMEFITFRFESATVSNEMLAKRS